MRANFEQQAKKQARLVDSLYTLYPKILNELQITAARVEEMMRHSQPEVDIEEEAMAISR